MRRIVGGGKKRQVKWSIQVILRVVWEEAYRRGGTRNWGKEGGPPCHALSPDTTCPDNVPASRTATPPWDLITCPSALRRYLCIPSYPFQHSSPPLLSPSLPSLELVESRWLSIISLSPTRVHVLLNALRLTRYISGVKLHKMVLTLF